jgi:hypothetical protein
MDWTTMGHSEPTFTPPTSTVTALRRGLIAIVESSLVKPYFISRSFSAAQ